jgi:hypothetical protein
VDASRQSTFAGLSVFMMTDAELKAASEQTGKQFYSFDAEKYPSAK